MERQSSGAGKGKETSPPGKKMEGQSMASRIAASASGLAKELVGSSSTNGLSQTLASSSSMSGKPQSFQTSAGSSTWTETLPSRPNAAFSSTHLASNGAQGSYEGFRQPAPCYGEVSDLDDFLSGPDYYNDVGAPSAGHEPSWTTQFQQQSSDRPFHLNSRTNGHATTDTAADYDDGAEVRALLSDPTFTADAYPTDATMEDRTEDFVADLFPQNFSEEEQHVVDHIRSSLPAPPVHQPVPRDHPLNLRPQFASLNAANPLLHQEIAELASTLGSGEKSYMYFTTPTQREHWLSEWDDVLNSYTDEVWGDLLPAVQVARAQVKEVMAGTHQLDSKAVVRLKMILGHVMQKSAVASTADALPALSASRSQESEMQGLETTGLVNGMRHLTSDETKSMNGFTNAYAAIHMPLQHQPLPYHPHSFQVEEPSQHAEAFHQQSNAGTAYQNGHHEQRQRPQEPPEEEKEIPIPSFHCPWISCHERFNDAAELRLHSRTHQPLACPHTDCRERFPEPEQWTEHIQSAHHDLLDTSIGRKDESDG